MAQPASLEGDSSIIVDLSEAAMHMYTAAIDALPFAEDKKFHKRADVVLSGMRKLRAALTDAASSSRPSPAVIVALSNVRRRYDALMEHVAAAPGSSVGQQVYATRIQARLSAREVENGAGVREGLLDDLEGAQLPPTRKRRRSWRRSPPSAACPARNTCNLVSQRPTTSPRSPQSHTSTGGTKTSSAKTPANRKPAA